jgi:hypothetical protein
MDYFAIWKLAVDVLLVLALVHLCYRFARSGSSAGVNTRFAGLETSLRMLVQDADNAGQVLNEKWLKRKSSLEKLLFDLETVEQRLNRAITIAEGSKGEIESEAGRLQNLIHQAGGITSGAEHSAAAARPIIEPERVEAKTNVQRAVPPSGGEVPEPASFQHEGPSTGSDGAGRRASKADWENLNIYGEPITPARTALAPEAVERRPEGKRTSALARAIEKEALPRGYDAAGVSKEVQGIYDAAENLLRSGASLETVSAETELPPEEVRLLSQMIRQEKAMSQSREGDREDTRLGVLGSGITRRVQTL